MCNSCYGILAVLLEYRQFPLQILLTELGTKLRIASKGVYDVWSWLPGLYGQDKNLLVTILYTDNT